MTSAGLLRAREAFAQRAWTEAYAGFVSAGEPAALQLDDYECWATAALLTGRIAESRDALAQGYREALRAGDFARSARFAFWIGHGLMFRGSPSEATGWFARARQLLASRDLHCVEQGYLLIPEGVYQIDAGDHARAGATFSEAREFGTRFGDVNLVAMAGHGLGRALIRLGEVDRGMAVLDEVMVAVTSGEVSPMVVGDVYCGVLEACHEVFDLRRAREWTGALSRWCEGQPDLVAYRGPCLVYRAEVMQFHGAWSDAFEEARRACDWLSSPASPEGAADAYYRMGELHRLRGEFPEAEQAYRQASRLGRQTEPGMPLLWLARGQFAASRAAVGRALREEKDLAKRATLLDAEVQVLIAIGDAEAARAAAIELSGIAAELDAPVIGAIAATAEGTVLLAEGQAAAALAPLRRAWTGWQKLEAPYEAARVRLLIGLVCRDLGDEESAAMEFDAARWVFQQLGASPDLGRLDALASTPDGRPAPGGLSAREVEVLRHIAGGGTNKEIGAALVISEHTVARHVQNMLSKLGCSSRTALATFAVEHGLVSSARSQH